MNRWGLHNERFHFKPYFFSFYPPCFLGFMLANENKTTLQMLYYKLATKSLNVISNYFNQEFD